MGNFFDGLEKHKFGVLTAIAALIGAFIYLQMDSFPRYTEISAFHVGAKMIIPPEEILLQPENIMLPPEYRPDDLKNMSRDANDKRERSNDKYYENSASKSAADVEKQIKDLEAQMKADAGGAEARKHIREEINKRKEQLKNDQKKPPVKDGTADGGDKAFAGNVMVNFDVPQHTAHQNNNWYVRNPGYTCPAGSDGMVFIVVKVNQAGNVLSATYDASRSSGANSCMVEQAQKYARISRFNFSDSAPGTQTGWIQYIFSSH